MDRIDGGGFDHLARALARPRSRRELLRCLAGGVGSALLAAPVVGARAARPTPMPTPGSGTCGGNLGIEMLRVWSLGGFPVPLAQAMPGPNWVLYVHPAEPGLIDFLHPPDWTAVTLTDPGLTGVRLISPDQRSVTEGANTVVPAAGVTAVQAAEFGLRRVLDLLDPTLAVSARRLCADDLPAPAGSMTGLSVAFEAVAAGSLLAAAQGMVSPMPTGGTFALYRAMAAPAAALTALTRQVFLPLLYQVSLSGGGNHGDNGAGNGTTGNNGGEPTPTPAA